jgi:hypothetical protein
VRFLTDDMPEVLSLRQFSEFLGLGGRMLRPEIERSFLRETGYMMDLRIEDIEETCSVDEKWEFEIYKGSHKHAVRARRGYRGTWVCQPDNLPLEILSFVQADKRSREAILSTRCWNEWSQAKWADCSFRRRKSSSDVIRFSMVMKGIKRNTGVVWTRMEFTSLCLEDESGPVREILRLPMKSRDLRAAISRLSGIAHASEDILVA